MSHQPLSFTWVQRGFLAEAHWRPSFLHDFREKVAELSPLIRLGPDYLEALARDVFHNEDRSLLRNHLRSLSSDAGAVVLRSGGQLGADELTALLLALGLTLGPVMPELGSTGASWRRLCTTYPLGGRLTTPTANNYHRNPYMAFPLHTDGAYHFPRPEWVALGKVGEWAADGGDSLLLHVAEWEDLLSVLDDPRAYQDVYWTTPGQVDPKEISILESAGVATNVWAPAFETTPEGVRVRLGLRPPEALDSTESRLARNQEEFFQTIEESMMRSPNVQRVRLDVGDVYLINNLSVLHGRTTFAPNPALRRDVVRVRGIFHTGIA